jgi:hypothetical protein
MSAVGIMFSSGFSSSIDITYTPPFPLHCSCQLVSPSQPQRQHLNSPQANLLPPTTLTSLPFSSYDHLRSRDLRSITSPLPDFQGESTTSTAGAVP